MATLSLAMIVKNEQRSLRRILDAARRVCDELIVVDTGSTDGTQDIARAVGAKVFHFDWVDDFAAARNYAFAQCTQDWILWLDADDVLNEKSIAAILQHKNDLLNRPHFDAIFTAYHYEYTHAGAVAVILHRERFLRRSANYQWVGRIHEVVRTVASRSTHVADVVIEHRPHPDDLPRKKGRNLANYEAWIDTATSDLRDVFLYGSELLWDGRAAEAIGVLQAYLKRAEKIGSDAVNERYMAYIKLADSLMMVNRRAEATHVCLQAIELNPARAEGYCLAGLNFTQQGQWRQAWPMLVAAAACPPPGATSGLVVNKFYSETPMTEMARCLYNLKDPRPATQLRDVLLKLAQKFVAPRTSSFTPVTPVPVTRVPQPPLRATGG